jgi:hypothetical protein
MSLPFCESEPLSKTHLRRFEAADILEIFPNASYTLLDRPRMPWMIMEERFDGTTPGIAGNGTTPVRSTTDDPRDATIAQLRAELAALQSRKVVRAANLMGRGLRRLRSRLRR